MYAVNEAAVTLPETTRIQAGETAVGQRRAARPAAGARWARAGARHAARGPRRPLSTVAARLWRAAALLQGGEEPVRLPARPLLRAGQSRAHRGRGGASRSAVARAQRVGGPHRAADQRRVWAQRARAGGPV